MNEEQAKPRQRMLATTILMGTNRIVVDNGSLTYKTPGVYIEEIPSGVND